MGVSHTCASHKYKYLLKIYKYKYKYIWRLMTSYRAILKKTKTNIFPKLIQTLKDLKFGTEILIRPTRVNKAESMK